MLIVIIQKVLLVFNAQHDCRTGKCLPSAVRPQMQEREETTRTVQLITHKDDGHFVINLTSLHNAAQIRKVLPRHLTAPRALYIDRRARHFEIAAKLRITQAEKWEQSKAKAKATRAANKAKKHDREAAMEVEIEGDALADQISESESDVEDSEEEGNGSHNVQLRAKRRRTHRH